LNRLLESSSHHQEALATFQRIERALFPQSAVALSLQRPTQDLLNWEQAKSDLEELKLHGPDIINYASFFVPQEKLLMEGGVLLFKGGSFLAKAAAPVVKTITPKVVAGLAKIGILGKVRGGAKEDVTRLFVNQFPEHELECPNLIPPAQLKNINGKFNYVITEDGNLIVGKGGRVPGRGHIDLANAQPVRAAGEVKVVDGQIKYIDNSSGHYQPNGISAQLEAETAFNKLGFDTTNKYIEKFWLDDPSMQNGGAWRPKQ